MFTLQGVGGETKTFERDGHLSMRSTGQREVQLFYQGNREFRIIQDARIKIVFSNSESPDFAMHKGSEIVNGLRILESDLLPSAADIERFSGTYVLERVNHEVEIRVIDGYLYIQPKGRSSGRLNYQGNGVFRAADDPATKVVFDAEPARHFELHAESATIRGIRQADG
jgi:hypothetical protein